MQYIKKKNVPPADWDTWFTKATGIRSFDYGTDYSSLTNLKYAKKYLLAEQHGLCAYCQQAISIDGSSIEHVIPKEFNKELSTCYYNLVAVCKNPIKEPGTGKLHCDKEKLSQLITPFIFVSNSDVTQTANNCYFVAWSDGTITAKHLANQEHKIQTEAFINVLHLNHTILKEKRAKDVLDGLIKAYSSIPFHNRHQKDIFWETQFNRIFLHKSHPFRQFLLIYIANNLGRN